MAHSISPSVAPWLQESGAAVAHARHRHNLKPEQQLRLMAYLAERPALDLIYRFKQRLCYLLLKKHKTKRQCQKLIPYSCAPWSSCASPDWRNW